MAAYFRYIVVALLPILATCGMPTSDTLTDLGTQGNLQVTNRFEKYKNARQNGLSGCNKSGNGSRIVISGFGPFLGTKQNISGLVAESIATIKPTGNAGAYGIEAAQAEFVFNGKQVTVCAIVLEVQWDLAAAGVLFEIEKFAPDAVIMTGLGSAGIRLEAGAINNTTNLSGYDQSGSASGDKNRPISKWVLLSEQGIEDSIKFYWNPQKLAVTNSPALETLNRSLGLSGDNAISLLPQTAPNPQNNYICNNIAFVVQHGLKGVPVSLAGGNLIVNPAPNRVRSSGFLHFPKNALTTSASVAAWRDFMLNIATSSLQNFSTNQTASLEF